jgi:quinol monooxygenase YgiN
VIIVNGSITGTEATIDELLARSLEHVRRSREEPGCISHAVALDAENPLRLVFFEQWEDIAALKTHFGVPAAIEFARLAVDLGEVPPTLDLFEASVTSPR